MAYEYVKQYYGVPVEVGQRVTFSEVGCARKDGLVVGKLNYDNYDNYVYVRFDGQKHDIPCHPLSLEYHTEKEG